MQTGAVFTVIVQNSYFIGEIGIQIVAFQQIGNIYFVKIAVSRSIESVRKSLALFLAENLGYFIERERVVFTLDL